LNRREFIRNGLCVAAAIEATLEQAAVAQEEKLILQVERGLIGEKGPETIQERMAHHKVPALGVAVVHQGALKWAKGYGEAEAGTERKVTKDTLFQAASISKAVTALGAMRLVQEGKLTLDDDVNRYLRSWKVPPSEAAHGKPVTLRGLLSHSAGLNVHGFPGYSLGATVPSLLQVLDGQSPANTPPIRVVFEPGTKHQYSGGGFCIVQQLIEDVSGQSFPEAMRELVLDRITMKVSTFEQPLPSERVSSAATAHETDGHPISGRWHVYPERAAAGLWTTPADLAHFGLELAKSVVGRSNRVLKVSTAREMLSRQRGGYGLGVGLSREGANGFMHNGANAGFRCAMIICLDTGDGVVVMTNGENGDALYNEVVKRILEVYGWPRILF